MEKRVEIVKGENSIDFMFSKVQVPSQTWLDRHMQNPSLAVTYNPGL